MAMASIVASAFLLMLLSFVVVSAQRNGTRILAGTSLIAGNTSVQPWRSPSGDFAFGFHNYGNDLFLLAIWFYKVPENNVVWFAEADDDNPVLAPRGSKIELTASDGLVLRNPSGGEIWKSEPITAPVAFGTMNDTGNFVLVDTINGSVWESFTYPTDTLLPTQKLEIGGVISSRKSQGNFSIGRFQFRLLGDGNAVLNTMSSPPSYSYDAYYISNTADPASTQNSGNEVIFDEHGFLYVLKNSGAKVNITELIGNPAEAFYYKATINFDGVLTVSSYPKGPGVANGSWRDLYVLPENICTSILHEEMFGSGICGYNSICSLKSNGRPSCNCPLGYSLIDPNDEYGNCKPDITPSCEEEEGGHNSNHSLYEMVDIQNTNWPMHDYERFLTSNDQECRNSCLEDCLCVLVVFGARNDCWKKRLPLSNGRRDASIKSISSLKLRKNVSLESFPDVDVAVRRAQKKQTTIIVVMSALFGSSVLVSFILFGCKCLSFFALKKEILVGTCTKNVALECNLIQFAYKDLYKATDGFKEELGR
ncbi:G-type lectin S-receptor-like serine/threonine-protein kinase RLK1, partial [Momordica charantia]|uniref:G-type lectin S-receptor-like serine/threonine-protein kinase RLK1 n=1 Tax=Momordica charantia TaxID=3673 RepID=A0A6J1DYQ3_MOMCH